MGAPKGKELCSRRSTEAQVLYGGGAQPKDCVSIAEMVDITHAGSRWTVARNNCWPRRRQGALDPPGAALFKDRELRTRWCGRQFLRRRGESAKVIVPDSAPRGLFPDFALHLPASTIGRGERSTCRLDCRRPR